MSQEHLKLISGYKIPQRTLGSILDILGLEKPWSRTTCSLGIHGYGHGNSFLILFQFSVQVNWSLLILPLPKKLPMVDLTIFLIKVLIKTFSFFQQDSSELTGKKNKKKKHCSGGPAYIFSQEHPKVRFLIRTYTLGPFLLKRIPLYISYTQYLIVNLERKMPWYGWHIYRLGRWGQWQI